MSKTDLKDWTYGEEDVGCYFDCVRGRYIGEDVIEMAEDRGFVVAKEDEENRHPDGEFYSELWEEAEEYLNEMTKEGFYFGSNENGDWGLWEEEEGKE